MTSQTLQKVDHSALKANQLVIITLSVLAFILNQPILAAFVALVMGIGSALKVPGFGFVYKSLLKPRGWMKPDVLNDNPEPHRFAQFLGFLFMTAGSIALFLGVERVRLVAGVDRNGSCITECIRRILCWLRSLLLAGADQCAWV